MFTLQKKLKPYEQYKQLVPISQRLRDYKQKMDKALKANLSNHNKFVVVCGPCSADSFEAMDEYLVRLSKSAKQCRNLLVVARIYTAKPHSNGKGYKGSAFSLSVDAPTDLDEGIVRCRKIMLRSLELGLPVADELLYPDLFECFDDLVSYWFIGARSTEDTLHRDIASGLDVCCGVKNPTDGSITKAIDSLQAISSPCVFPYGGSQFATDGCKYANLVLRGGTYNGGFRGNISPQDIDLAKRILRERGLNDFVLADLNHANSAKHAERQIENAILALDGGANGVMIESFLNFGGQSNEYGTSKTDECLDIESTIHVIRKIDSYLEFN